MKEQIDLLLKDVNKLPPMSNVVLKVMELVQDPSVSIQILAAEISKDPGITASIIKISNSAYYRASKPIRTVQEALMTLGIQTVKEIVVLTASKAILKKDLKGYQLEADDSWAHSITVAELSSKIVTHKKLPIRKDLVFTSGLLHDIGKVVLAQFFPMKMLEIRDEVKNLSSQFTDVEKKYFGYSHEEVGLKLLDAWNFPDELKEVVAYHHKPELSKKFPLLVSVVHIANTIAIICGIGIDIGGTALELSNFALQTTGVSEADVELYFTNIPELQKSISELKNF
ncbi:MAG: HDOD domain-containing protein [Leptospiraceae bacterium]|nr:HDOD domain-containing protein [Leptospiraceae bacterium]